METLREEVKGKDLPKEWRDKANVSPDEIVEIVIQPPRSEQLKKLFGLMDSMSDEAKRNGLTEEKLAELLSEE